MAIQTLRNAPALDNTLQSTNGLLSTQNGKIDNVVTAIMNIALASVGNISALTTTDKTSLVGAVNELNAGKVSTSSVGVAGGVAELDNTGKVPASQLPAFVDDVIEGYLYNGNFYEDSAHTQLITPEDGKIYIDLVSNKTYRWSGSQYTVISDTLALGETSTTAYRGDRGKTAYDHSQDANRVTTAKAEGLYKIGATAQGHISSATAVTKGDIIALGLVGSVTDSTTNGNILVDGSEVQVYDDTDVTNDITDIEGKLTTATTSSTGNPINFSTLSAQNAESTIIDLEPIQDLHGYDKPWVGGAGKNKLPLVLADIKTENTSGTWNGNIFTHNNGASFEVLLDNGNNIIGFKLGGNATGNCNLRLTKTQNLGLGGKLLSGINLSQSIYLGVYDDTLGVGIVSEGGDTVIPTEYTNYRTYLRVNQGISPNVTVYPMVRNSGETNSFAPYTNNCPITGRTEIGIEGCGKNLFNPDTFVQGLLTSTGVLDGGGAWITSDYIKVQGTTTIQGWKDGTESNFCVRFCEYDSNKNFLKNTSNINISDTVFYSRIITLNSNTRYIRASFGFDNKATSVSAFFSTNRIMLELGSTATSYDPYTKSNDITITFGETVYGGSLDVEKGELTVIDGRIDMGTLTWIQHPSSDYGYYAQMPTNPVKANGKLICDSYIQIETLASADFGICTASLAGYVYVKDSNIASNPTSMKTALNGVYLVYELATPTVIQLTPHQISLLKGVNNISVSDDYSTITLTYRSGEVATLGDLLETETKMLAKQHNYSTDEQVVGTWIDGSTVYEKVFTSNSITAETDMNLGSISNLSEVISAIGILKTSDGFFPSVWGYGTSEVMQLKVSSGNVMVYVKGQFGTLQSFKATIRYTKST